MVVPASHVLLWCIEILKTRSSSLDLYPQTYTRTRRITCVRRNLPCLCYCATGSGKAKMQGKINNKEGPGIRMLFSGLYDLQKDIASERQGLTSPCGRLNSTILPVLEVGIISQFGYQEILVLMPAVNSQKS